VSCWVEGDGRNISEHRNTLSVLCHDLLGHATRKYVVRAMEPHALVFDRLYGTNNLT
jgi:hypothetical protein